MAKDGSFYWVFTNVTPSYDQDGKMIGYLSVRRKPKAAAVKAADGLYKAMLAAEQQAGTKDAIAASSKILADLLTKSGLSYDEFVLSL